MGIAKSVELLAKAVADRMPLNEWQREAVMALSAMPKYLSERRLDLWERETQACWPDGADGSEVGTLLWSVFELGRSNLYQAFDPAASADALIEVETNFVRAGIMLPDGVDVHGW